MANVLIVEDSKSAAAAQAYSLWELGHTVTFAYNAKEAKASFKDANHELVLLDFDLPDGTGLDVFRALRQVDPDVCVVMVTGKGDESLAAQVLKEGAKDYIPKTCELMGILPEVVDRIIKEKQGKKHLSALKQEIKDLRAELADMKARLREETLNHQLTQKYLAEAEAKLKSKAEETGCGNGGCSCRPDSGAKIL